MYITINIHIKTLLLLLIIILIVIMIIIKETIITCERPVVPSGMFPVAARKNEHKNKTNNMNKGIYNKSIIKELLLIHT